MSERKYVKGIPIETVVEKYKECGNVWKVGDFFGISGQTIHHALNQVGVNTKMNYFAEDDKNTLIAEYVYYRDHAMLDVLAKKLGRTKQFLCRKAKELGLTGMPKHYVLTDQQRNDRSERTKESIAKYGHPRGMLGKRHSEKTLRRISVASKQRWDSPDCVLKGEKYRKIRSDSMMKAQEEGLLSHKSRCKSELVSVGSVTFKAMSSWEYDVALYLEYLKTNRLIDDWGYETDRYVFKYNHSGVRSYKPDFTVYRGDIATHIEVKGWEDEKYHIKRRLMEEEYPNVRILYLRQKEYSMIEKKYGNKLRGFGSLLSTKPTQE